jgi:hypothetical protein
MNLLYCADCRHAFTAPGGGDQAEGEACVLCGGPLSLLAREVIQVSPLGNAHESRAALGMTEAVGVASVAIRCRQDDGDGGRILANLSAYFQVVTTDSGAQVCVDRGPPTDAPWRLAAILDGIDGGWEEHLFIPELAALEAGPGV